jgi:hypothetical protein
MNGIGKYGLGVGAYKYEVPMEVASASVELDSNVSGP